MSATEIFYIFWGNSKTHPLFSQQKRNEKIRQNADRRITDKRYQNILTEKKIYKNNKTSYVHDCTTTDRTAEI